MHVSVSKRSSGGADTVQYNMPYPDVCVMRVLWLKSCVYSRAAEACLTQAHRL